MVKKVKVVALKKELEKKTKHELIDEIASLCKRFDNVNEFYSLSLSSSNESLHQKYKNTMMDEFVPSARVEFPKMRLSVARKAISEYKKFNPPASGIADLMVSYVEAGVKCTKFYGDIDEKFYSSMESMYESAIKTIIKEGFGREFNDRLVNIVSSTSGMGWRFHDTLSDLYSEYKEPLTGKG